MKLKINRNLLIGLLLAGAAILLYYPTIGYEFVFDDELVIAGNHLIRNLEYLPDFFTSPTYSFYRPIRSISYLLDYRYWGLNPAGFHLSNILLHGLCCFSFYLLLLLRGTDVRTRVAAVLIFLVHPINSETVIYLSSRAELLGTLFTLLYLTMALRYLYSRKFHHLLISLLFLSGALLSKESFAIAPLLFLIFLPPDSPGPYTIREKKRRKMFISFSSIILTGVFLVFRFLILNTPTSLGQFDRLLTFPQIFIKIPSVLLEYFRLLLFPLNLSPHHPLAVIPLPSPELFAIQAVGLAGIIILLLGLRRYGRLPFQGCLWILVSLIPVSNIYPLPRLLAEKYLYLSSLGFSLLVASFLTKKQSSGKIMRQSFLVIIVITFAGLTFLRQPTWRSNYSLWEKTSRRRPSSPLTLYNWGMAQIREGEIEDGVASLQSAEAILPGQEKILERIADGQGLLGEHDQALKIYLELLHKFPDSPDLHFKAGLAYKEQGYSRLAEHYYDEAGRLAQKGGNRQIQQLFTTYREIALLKKAGGNTIPTTRLLEDIAALTPADPEINLLLGKEYEAGEQWEEALECYSRIIDINGPTAELLYRQGKVYEGAKQFKKAMQSYHQALRHNPKFSPPYFDLGGLLAAYGEYEPAARFYRAGLKLRPDDYRAHTNLGSIYQFQEKYPEAVAEYERSLEIEDSYKARYNLGFLYLNKLNQPDRAIPHLTKALLRATDPAQKKKLQESTSGINSSQSQ